MCFLCVYCLQTALPTVPFGTADEYFLSTASSFQVLSLRALLWPFIVLWMWTQSCFWQLNALKPAEEPVRNQSWQEVELIYEKAAGMSNVTCRTVRRVLKTDRFLQFFRAEAFIWHFSFLSTASFFEQEAKTGCFWMNEVVASVSERCLLLLLTWETRRERRTLRDLQHHTHWQR